MFKKKTGKKYIGREYTTEEVKWLNEHENPDRVFPVRIITEMNKMSEIRIVNDIEEASILIAEQRKDFDNLYHEFITLKNKVYAHVNQIKEE